MDPDLHALDGGSSDFRDIAAGAGVGAVVNDIAVIIDLYPAASADTTVYGGRGINHMRVFLSRCRLPRQIEVKLSGFARLRLGINDGCFDLSTDHESDFISANSQAVAGVMAVGVGLNNLGKILRFNPDIGAFDWMAVGVFHKSFKNRGASPDGECYKQ